MRRPGLDAREPHDEEFAVAAVAVGLRLATTAPAFATDYRGKSCKNCVAPRPHYDSQEVVRTTKDVDHSRVINTAERGRGAERPGPHPQSSRDPQEHDPPRRRGPPQPHHHREGNPLQAAARRVDVRASTPGPVTVNFVTPEVPHRASAGAGRRHYGRYTACAATRCRAACCACTRLAHSGARNDSSLLTRKS